VMRDDERLLDMLHLIPQLLHVVEVEAVDETSFH
jgi:hypothetical protein